MIMIIIVGHSIMMITSGEGPPEKMARWISVWKVVARTKPKNNIV